PVATKRAPDFAPSGRGGRPRTRGRRRDDPESVPARRRRRGGSGSPRAPPGSGGRLFQARVRSARSRGRRLPGIDRSRSWFFPLPASLPLPAEEAAELLSGQIQLNPHRHFRAAEKGRDLRVLPAVKVLEEKDPLSNRREPQNSGMSQPELLSPGRHVFGRRAQVEDFHFVLQDVRGGPDRKSLLLISLFAVDVAGDDEDPAGKGVRAPERAET